MASKICILDDDHLFLQEIGVALAGAYQTTICSTVLAFKEAFIPRLFDLIVLDMRIEGGREGLDILKEIHRIDPYQPVVIATAYADTDTYLETLQAGALLYVDKNQHTPATLALLFDAVIQQGRLRRESAAASRTLERMDPLEIIGTSEPIRLLRSEIATIASHSPPIIVISGETGSGRELTARNIHSRGFKGFTPPLAVLPRSNVPAPDILRLLAGYQNSAGTQRGLLEEAHGSGLVVRCADHLPGEVLNYILACLDARGYQAGAGAPNYPLTASLYLLCENHKSIRLALGNRHAEFLYVPPLRDRKEDIPLLVSYLMDSQRLRGREAGGALDPNAYPRLFNYNWPGNVAELRLALECGALRANAAGSNLIQAEHLNLNKSRKTSGPNAWNLDYQEAHTQVELTAAAIEELSTTNKTKLSGFLHIQSPTTLTRRIERSLYRYPELRTLFPRVADAFLPQSTTAVHS